MVLLNIVKGLSSKGTPEEILEETIKRFGAFVMYTFLRYLEPDGIQHSYTVSLSEHGEGQRLFSLSMEYRKKHRRTWLKSAIPLSTMLFCFETLLGLVSQNRISSATGLQQSVDSTEFADYELEKDNYEFLTNFIKSKYPDIYNKIKEQENQLWDIRLKHSPNVEFY